MTYLDHYGHLVNAGVCYSLLYDSERLQTY